jgi:HD-GYP domain-containing protein (c-di-GMP phosphodiesterase class II)
MKKDILRKNLPNPAQKLEVMFQALSDLLIVLDGKGSILDYKVNQASILFKTPANYDHEKIQDIFPPDVSSKLLAAVRKAQRTGKVVAEEYSLALPVGERSYEAHLAPIQDKKTMLLVRDITNNREAEAGIQRQLDRLASLRAIDLAITSGLDLNLTLSMILGHVTAQLDMDAATVLLLDPHTQMFEYAAGMGFTTTALQHTHLRIGEGGAGKAALKRKAIYISDLRNRKTDFLRSPSFQREGFVAYYAVPLMTKGQVAGVLEIFRRSSFEATPDWLDFLNTMAGQAAVAIDNTMLFRNLQRSNIELTLAYDKTIEGWSHALDLRDKETEGHTRRVTEMTLRLARQLSLPDSELVHIRRGAILHDIGKVAIPDSILLKPGPLDEHELAIMRQHPLIAVDLLTPISYLVSALAIPRSHHEKWDGSGYPDGLAGERIPLPARLFALVDVYDALTSDRPYRKAWTQSRAVEYITEQSGQYFDPSVVPVFLNMMSRPKARTREELYENKRRGASGGG